MLGGLAGATSNNKVVAVFHSPLNIHEAGLLQP
jgi:hypothetical protein